MKCPKENCKGKLMVKSNFLRKNGLIMTRHRVCNKCGYIYKTLEIPRSYYDFDQWLIKNLKRILEKYMEKKINDN